jgi:hypothetical protein
VRLIQESSIFRPNTLNTKNYTCFPELFHIKVVTQQWFHNIYNKNVWTKYHSLWTRLFFVEVKLGKRNWHRGESKLKPWEEHTPRSQTHTTRPSQVFRGLSLRCQTFYFIVGYYFSHPLHFSRAIFFFYENVHVILRFYNPNWVFPLSWGEKNVFFTNSDFIIWKPQKIGRVPCFFLFGL